MCLAICGKIKSITFPFAQVEIGNVETKVNIQLIEDPRIEDLLLIHAGFAIQKVDEAYFNNIEEVLAVLFRDEEK